MADERTPLVHVVHVAPPHQRYSHSTLRRFCTVGLGATLVVVVILFLIPLRWLPGEHHGGGEWNGTRPWPDAPWPGKGDGWMEHSSWEEWKENAPKEWGQEQAQAWWSFAQAQGKSKQSPSEAPHKSWPQSLGLDRDELLDILMTAPDPAKAREWSEYYTSGPHLAGRNLSQAVRTLQWWQEFGIDSIIYGYDVYINYPAGHGLKLLEKKEKSSELGTLEAYKTVFEATLEEDVLDEDPTTALDDRIMTFHGYSASGNVTGSMVFCNWGTYADFEDLVAAGVDLAGKIAIVKYGGVFRGLKVKRAQELGMVGVIIYSDPQEDGAITEANGYLPYPDGPARNPSAVQRGSVQFLSFAPGDPTTPGYPSLPGAPRQNVSGAIPSIPSLPISYKEAIPFLKALNGHGLEAVKLGKRWEGGGLTHKGVNYNIGPSEAVVNLVNEQEYVTTPLWNVIGVINGTIADEVVVVGNHRDAWIAGGGVDPNSGSAALNELIRSVGMALKKGWKPLRTIVFASWDGEEYGLVGSTEWVEQFLPWLSGSTVAYINVDVGAGGPEFTASASPLLDKVLYKAVANVPSPNQTVLGQSVGDVWNGHIATMGSGSDFTAFQDFAGIPSLDFGFKQSADSAVYHYHSNYDSFHWVDNFGDRTWGYHVAAAQIIAQALVGLVEEPVLPLNATDYALGLRRYVEDARRHAERAAEASIPPAGPWYTSLRDSVDKLLATARRFDAHAAGLRAQVAQGVPWWDVPRRVELYRAVREVNTKLKFFERQFLYQKGLDGRPWFKHVVFAPGLWTGYAGATFPGIVESIDRSDLAGVLRWSAIIKDNIYAGVEGLQIDRDDAGGLTTGQGE